MTARGERGEREMVWKRERLTLHTVTARPLKRSSRPPDARRAQERGDPERTLGSLRYLDEPDAEGGCAD